MRYLSLILSFLLTFNACAQTSSTAIKNGKLQGTLDASALTNKSTVVSDLGAQPLDSDLTSIAALSTTSFGRSVLAIPDAAAALTYFGLGTAAVLATDTDGTLAANSDSRLATQKAVKTYVDTAVTGLLDFKGVTDCSGSPNYPSALKGDAYIVSVAGKIGGASGTSVDIGDVYLAIADNAGGTQGSVGTSWKQLEHNLVGALLSANNLSDLASASAARTNLGLGTLATQSGTFSGTSSGTNTGDQTITLTGGVTGSGTGSFAATVVTNANLTGDVTSVGNATTLTNAPVIAKVLTGYTAGAGTVSSTDSILAAIQKLAGNTGTAATNAGTLNNLTIVPSRSAGAETISIKTQAGTDASATDPISISFRDAALTTGGYVRRTLTAADSITIPSTAGLGTIISSTVTITSANPGVVTYASHGMRPDDSIVFSTTGALPTNIVAGTTYFVSRTGFTTGTFQVSATSGGASINTTSGAQSGTQTLTIVPKPFRVWLVYGDDAGTLRLGVIRCDMSTGTSLGTIYPLKDDMIVSSTILNSSSNSSGVFYSGTAWTSKAIRVLGYLDYTLTVAGTWNAAPTWVQVMAHGCKYPGDRVQLVRSVATSFDTTATASGLNVTVAPTSANGKQFMSATITPTSAANVIAFRHHAGYACSAADFAVGWAIRDSDTLASAVTYSQMQSSNNQVCLDLIWYFKALSTSASAFKLYAAPGSTGTLTFNGISGATWAQGLQAATLELEEIMM